LNTNEPEEETKSLPQEVLFKKKKKKPENMAGCYKGRRPSEN